MKPRLPRNVIGMLERRATPSRGKKNRDSPVFKRSRRTKDMIVRRRRKVHKRLLLHTWVAEF
jgi:hypothetical protein